MAKSARRSRDDDEDEPPRRSRPSDDDEDDRPRRRARRRDDGDDDGLPPGTPRVYVHKACKGKTVMPAEVVAEYLENPFELGEDPGTFCTECEGNVPWKDCAWVETKQNLYEYIDDVRAEMVLAGTDPRPNPPAFNWMFPILGVGLGAGCGAGLASGVGQSAVLFGVIGGAGGLAAGVVWMFIDRAKFIREIEVWNRKLLKRYYKRHPEARSNKKRPRDDD